LLIMMSLLAAIILWARPGNRFVVIGEVIILVFTALGFFDDWTKIAAKRVTGKSEGISSRFKFMLQIAVAGALAFYLAINPSNAMFPLTVNVPFAKELFLDLGVMYFFLLMLFFVGFTNSVNLTDGLDGLAIGNVIIAAGALLVFVYVAGHAKFSEYLKVVPVSDAGELTVVLAAMIGAGLGFLWFNANPAQVFMGDTGSLPLGALLVFVSIAAKQELLLPIIGGVFLLEAGSVMAQITYFKLTGGKRIFKMAPLHHHFELLGIPEQKVVVRFWIAGIVLALLAMASLKVR
ncbi:MAG: phospho-N-acetylmuramoyl-pentapeptide-transferase, partial [Elusimicrobiota bacterium]